MLVASTVGCALVTAAAVPVSANRYQWDFPLAESTVSDISARFDLPFINGGSEYARGHRGIDFPASVGEEVHAVGDGIVYFAGVIAGKPTVSIDHGDRLKIFGLRVRSTYEPVRSTLVIGQRVARGEVIGVMSHGNSHCSGKCLHFGLKVDTDNYVNPALLWVVSPSLLPSARG